MFKGIIAEARRLWESLDSNIWVDKDEMELICLVLYYNGIEIGRITEDGRNCKITFFATRRRIKRIQKDIHEFCIPYKYATWGV